MMVRRLPVVQSEAARTAELSRTPWQWVLMGAGFTISLWIPLLALLLWVRARVLPARLVNASEASAGAASGERWLVLGSALVPVLLPWFLASALAGALIGRFGAGTDPRHCTYAGALAGGLAAGLAVLGGQFGSVFMLFASTALLTSTAAVCAWLGGKFGRRRRGRT